MNLREGLRIGWLEIRSHKLRAFLTLSGIAVGITSVMAMTGILSGFQANIREGLARGGLGRLWIVPRPTNDQTHRSTGLLYDDALAIRRAFPGARAVSPIAQADLPVFYRDFRAKAEVLGVTRDWAKLDWNYKVRGRFLNESDMRDSAPVCVLIKRLHDKKTESEDAGDQDDPLRKLFQRHDPLRATIQVGGAALRVVGVLEELPRDDDMDFSDGNPMVLLPITSFQKRLAIDPRHISFMSLDSGDQKSSYLLAKRMFSFLKRRHRGVEDFQIMNSVDMMGPFLSWFDMATVIIGAVGAIALFAGGVGIMNISLASVNARIKEIGIRKSLGARERDIRRQFLLEAATLSLMGGVLGVLLGGGICLIVKLASDMSVVLSPVAAAVSIVVSIGVGVAFSWYPAGRAARLDPIEALRYE